MRKLIAALAVGAGVFAFGGTSSALAAPCIPTDLVRDGQVLTASLINPPAVTGDVDAGRCDIGVYVRHATTVIAGAAIHNARYFGVAVNGSDSSATISSS